MQKTMKISVNLQKNVRALKTALSSDDVKFKEIKVGDKKGVLVFSTDLTDKAALGSLVMRPAANLKGEVNEKTLSETFFSPETETSTDITETAEKIVGGESALLVESVKTAFLFGLKKFDKRAIAEPPTSTVIKGPREGFVENLAVNVSLMRRKLASTDLRFKYPQRKSPSAT